MAITSDIVAVDESERPVMVPTPTISNLNVTNSKKIHFGTKLVSITQNVHNPDLIKDLPLRRYLWDLIKNSSIAERSCCAVAIIVVITCVTLIVYFTTQRPQETVSPGKAPHEWKISREMWLAQPGNNTDTTTAFEPLMLVIIQNTVGSQCQTFTNCAAELRALQTYFLKSLKYDIPYNFLVGNDGRVYEGRGWNKVGAHTLSFNLCSIGIGYMGDYRDEILGHSSVTDAQLNRTRMILAEGVKLKYLRPDYLIVGARDLNPTQSPGSNLYAAIQRWPNYDHEHRFKGLTCKQINDTFSNQMLWQYSNFNDTKTNN